MEDGYVENKIILSLGRKMFTPVKFLEKYNSNLNLCALNTSVLFIYVYGIDIP